MEFWRRLDRRTRTRIQAAVALCFLLASLAISLTGGPDYLIYLLAGFGLVFGYGSVETMRGK